MGALEDGGGVSTAQALEPKGVDRVDGAVGEGDRVRELVEYDQTEVVEDGEHLAQQDVVQLVHAEANLVAVVLDNIDQHAT